MRPSSSLRCIAIATCVKSAEQGSYHDERIYLQQLTSLDLSANLIHRLNHGSVQRIEIEVLFTILTDMLPLLQHVHLCAIKSSDNAVVKLGFRNLQAKPKADLLRL